MKNKHTLLAMTNTAVEKRGSSRYPKHMEHIFTDIGILNFIKTKPKSTTRCKDSAIPQHILGDDLSKPPLAIDRSYRNPPKIGGK